MTTVTSLRVETAKTETTPGDFVTDGFRVTADGVPLYQSRSPLKAVIKAVILTEDERFKGAILSFEEGIPELAGKLNLAQGIDADRFQAVRLLALPEVAETVENFVEHVKEHKNHVPTPGEELPEPDED